MKAATSAAADVPLALLEMPPAALGARDVRVSVRAVGVNPVDWKMRAGGPLRLAHRFLGPGGPLVVGVDFAGVVTEAGPGADLAVGVRVVGGTDFSRKQRGSYADEVVVRDEQCAVLPADVSFERAACLPVAAVTPWISLTDHAHVVPGSRVLVLGASGGVGLFALSLSKMLGAFVAGVCSTRNVEVVERFGDVAIDYTRGDALTMARAHGPYDLVLYAIGTDVYPLDRAIALLTPSGTVDLAVPTPEDYLAIAFARQVTTVLGRPNRARLAPLVDALARGDLEPIIQATYPLADAEEAHRVSKADKVVGKLLLVP